MSQSQVQNNQYSNNLFNSQPIRHHSTFKCYLRTPDMRSIVENISTEWSVLELKQKARQLFRLNHVSNSESIILIVNEVELVGGIDLNAHLFNNAIIHVIAPTTQHHTSQQQHQQLDSSFIQLKIKQPPANCPILTIPSIPLSLTIKSLKQKILQFYRTEHPQNDISSLNENQLYLVYGGRVLTDQKILNDYGIDETGVLYVVNGRLYVREVTRQQAERRVNEIKGRVTVSTTQKQTKNHQQQDSEIRPQQSADTVEFNIIQNIVHDQDSQVEGQTANDLARSQKFIQRYNSISEKNLVEDNINEEKSTGLQIQQVQETPIVEDQNNEGFVVSGKGNTFKKIDIVAEGQEFFLQQKMAVDSYLDEINKQVADYQATRQQYNSQLYSTPIDASQQQQEEQTTEQVTDVNQSYESNNEQMLI